MSRGLGKREWHVLETLESYSQPAVLITGNEYWFLEVLMDHEPEDSWGFNRPPRSLVESTRRAVYSLRRKGLVETSYEVDGVEAIKLTARITDAGRQALHDKPVQP